MKQCAVYACKPQVCVFLDFAHETRKCPVATEVGKKPCYVMEFMWHRIFGEDGREGELAQPVSLRCLYSPCAV